MVCWHCLTPTPILRPINCNSTQWDCCLGAVWTPPHNTIHPIFYLCRCLCRTVWTRHKYCSRLTSTFASIFKNGIYGNECWCSFLRFVFDSKYEINVGVKCEQILGQILTSMLVLYHLRCARFAEILQNYSECQILWSLCSVVFRALTLKFPIQTSLSVVPKLPVSLSSTENRRKLRETSTPPTNILPPYG